MNFHAKMRITSLLAASIAIVAWTACRTTHASSDDQWAMSIEATGKTPTHKLTYRFSDDQPTVGTLTISAHAKGVQVVEKATMTWAARPITRQGHNVELDMELVTLKMAHRDPGPTWDHAQKARWILSDRGKTLRFVTDQLPSENLRGLPDLALLFRHLMPALPNHPVGPGAKWSLHQRFSMRLPGPTGTGTLVVTERIQYHWTNLANGKAHIQARLSSKYSGIIHPLGHVMHIAGKTVGTATIEWNLTAGQPSRAALSTKDEVTVTADDKQRNVTSSLTATWNVAPQ